VVAAAEKAGLVRKLANVRFYFAYQTDSNAASGAGGMNRRR
jgi:hypothetical protein